MAVTNTVSYQSRGIKYLIGSSNLPMPGISDIQQLGGGQSTEIDVTTLESEAVEVQIGLTDGGSVSIAGVAAPHSAAYQEVEDANINGKSLSVKVLIGSNATAAGADGTDVATGRTMTAAARTDVATKAKFTDSDNAGLPGIVAGDYLTYISGTDTENSKKIAAVTVSGDSAVFDTEHAFALTPAQKAQSKIKIVRPAILYSFTCLVPNIGVDLRTNDIIRFQATFRVTGKVTRSFGTPDVTV